MPGAASTRSGCTAYRRRRPERTCLYQAVLGHLETHLALAQDDQGERVAHHVEAQFRRYLECGIPRWAQSPRARLRVRVLDGVGIEM